jgi:choice-of-anchor B domain-containing protein
MAVIGAPNADGNAGRVAVFGRSDGGWAQVTWLDDGLRFDLIAGAETPCDGGRAAQFTCDNVDLLAYLPVGAFGGEAGEGVSDLWGWTDPVTGHEYALIGRTGGAAFIDITDPVAPVYVGTVPANNSGARDLKVYRDHLFFTGDGAGDHGLVVFDLTRLREVTQPPVEFEPDARYTEIASAHNLIIDTESGYAYPVGASGGGETCGGGLHMVDIRDPVNPTFAGCYTDTEGLIWAGRTHDGQCVVYRGPDEDYQGRQICFASNETALRIVDVTDKENPVPLAAVSYPGRAYIHQGWLTEDQQYFYLDDELDELMGQTDRTRTLILDVADLDDPVVVGQYSGSTAATDHNLYIKGDRMYQANYRAGLQVIDISDRENPVQVGHFDTTPYDDGNPPGFSGAWTAYPFFESGVVVVSSWWEGLFIVKPRPEELVP